MKTTIQIALAVVALVLSYFIYESIMKPVRFNEEKDRRRQVVIQKLKDIRTAQLAYKNVKGEFAKTFDQLIDFLKNGKFPVIKKIGNADDSGAVLIRDTAWVNVADSLFKGGYPKDSLSFIPFSGGMKFDINAGEQEAGKVKVKVFEVKAKNATFLKGLDEDMYKKDEEIILGSMSQPTYDGNWE